MSHTPRTDAVEYKVNDSNHTAVHASHARQLERELSMVKEQRDGAFALIEYAGELLGVKPEKHKSAHGFAVLQAIKDLIGSKS